MVRWVLRFYGNVFHIFGEKDDDWFPYDQRKTFDGYVVKRKTT